MKLNFNFHHLFFLLVLCTMHPVFSQSSFWKATNGPYGGTIHSFAADSHGWIYAATLNGLFRSLDTGSTWQSCYSNVPEREISRIVITKKNVIIIACPTGKIYRSDDSGKSWNKNTHTGFVTNFHLLDNYIFSSRIDNTVGNISEKGGVYSSLDDGLTWIEKSNGLSDGRVNSIKIDSLNKILYAATRGGVFRSTNYGTNWSKISNGINSSLQNFSFTLAANGNFIAGCSLPGGIFISTNQGSTWSASNSGIQYPDIWSLYTSPHGEIYAFCGDTLGSLYRSTNNGVTWSPTSIINIGGRRYAMTLPAAISTSASTFIGSNFGVHRSDDNGASWNLSNTGIQNTFVTDLFTVDDMNAYAATSMSGIFHTTDGGDSWQMINNGLFFFDFRSIIQTRKGSIFARMMTGELFKSSDQGGSWKQLNVGYRLSEVMPMAVSDSDHIFLSGVNRIVVGGQTQYVYGIFVSSNDGLSWRFTTDSSQRLYAHAIIFKDSTTLFADGNSGIVFCSTDHGWSWTQRNKSIFNIWTYNYDRDAHRLLAGTTDGLKQSMDDGLNWTKLTSTGKNGNWGLLSRGDLIMYSNEDATVQVSSDGGGSWNDISSGLDQRRIVMLNIANGGTLYGGTIGGVYKKFELLPPAPPHILIPNDSTKTVLQNFRLQWFANREALSYQIQISDDSPFNHVLFDSSKISTTSCAIPKLFDKKIYSWRVRSIGTGGSGPWSAVGNFKLDAKTSIDQTSISPSITLSANFPNPFSSSTSINYHLSSRGHVRLEVFDLLGRKVVTIVNEEKEAGEYPAEFNIQNSKLKIQPGVYFYRLMIGENAMTRKMNLMK